MSVLLNDIYVISIKVNNKVSGKVDEMLDVLGVMMEGVVEVDKEVDEILMEKKMFYLNLKYLRGR